MNFSAEPTPDQQAAARLTAWALRELPADSLTEFEGLLQADPDMENQAAGTREFCQLLESSLTPPSAAPLTLSPAIRQHLEAAAGPPAKSKVSLWMPSLAAAACFAVMLGVFLTSRSAPGPEKIAAAIASPNDQEVIRLLAKAESEYDLAQFAETVKTLKELSVIEPDNLRAHALWKLLDNVNTFSNGIGLSALTNRSPDDTAGTSALNLWETPVAKSPLLSKFATSAWFLENATQDHSGTSSTDSPKQWAYNRLDASPSRNSDIDSKSLLAIYDQPDTRPRGPYIYGYNSVNGDQAFKFEVNYNFGNDPKPVEGATPESLAEIQQIEPDGVKSAHTLEGQSIFKTVMEDPLSTFSIDVDTASYAIARRHLNEGERPPLDSVRLEEMINYFPMDDAPPVDGKPFAVQVETASAPWAAEHRLVRIALKGKLPPAEERRPAHLVLLVDTSGSMGQPNKLPLVQQSLRLLLDQLAPQDQVTLVTYAGDSELKLPATPVVERARIAAAIDALTSNGSTNGSGGIMAAYQQARAHFQEGGVNRVILATDGDFNVGLTGAEDLETLISREAKSGVYLSVLAYGSDNLKDKTAELLADKGNGNYAYIDSLSEARRALVSQLQGTLVTIAKDVKVQVEFNPAQVASYRLLGYENRALANKDFNDDTKDAGEIGAGHSVTALYEIVPPGQTAPSASAVDVLKYQTPPPPATALTAQAGSGELLTVKLRYQQPEGTAPSQLIEVPVKDAGRPWEQASANFRWTAAVAGYALLLRDSQLVEKLDWDLVRSMATASKGPDPDGFRGEFLQLIEKAASLAPRSP